jgi:oligoribonuclease
MSSTAADYGHPDSRYHRRMLAWMDLEMTGLDATRDVIVEIATLVTDDDLDLVAEGPDLVIHQTPETLEVMGDYVREMHTRSGLEQRAAAVGELLTEAVQSCFAGTKRIDDIVK